MVKRSLTIVLAVIVSTFFAGFGGGVVFPILPNLGKILGISPFVVGLILSANRFTRIVANAPAGSLVDRFGTRKPLIVGLLIEGSATLGYVAGVKSTIPEMWFLLARVFWGLGSALVFATAYTIAADVSDQQSRGTNMGVVRGGITFGFPAGLVLGGIISDLHSITAAFVLAAVFALLASGIAYLLVPETHVSTQQVTVKPWEINRSLPALTIGLVNFGLFFAYLGVLFSTLVLFIDSRGISMLNSNPQSISGLLMAITVLTASGSMIGSGKISDIFRSRIPVLLSFLLVSFVGFVLLATAESALTLVVACGFIGAGQGGTSGPLMALLADLTPDDQMGRATGTNNMMGDIGGGIGPVISLSLIDAIGFKYIYLSCATIPLFAGLILIGGIYTHTGDINPDIAPSSDD